MTASLRRHYAEVHKRRALEIVRRWWSQRDIPERMVGIVARTPKPCSSWCCGNPRRQFKHQTRQEDEAALSEREQVQSAFDEWDSTVDVCDDFMFCSPWEEDRIFGDTCLEQL